MTQFRPSALFRFANKMVTPLVSLGLPMGSKRAPMALLTVPGRKSGIPRTTPVALAPVDGGWLLVAVYGDCDWSRNLEAAAEAEITSRGRTTKVSARRLPPEEAGPILRDSITGAPAMIQRMTDGYFLANVDSPLEEWEKESVEHPVFILNPVLRITEQSGSRRM